MSNFQKVTLGVKINGPVCRGQILKSGWRARLEALYLYRGQNFKEWMALKQGQIKINGNQQNDRLNHDSNEDMDKNVQ